MKSTREICEVNDRESLKGHIFGKYADVTAGLFEKFDNQLILEVYHNLTKNFV